jgi:hypothetical protein
MGVPVLSIVNMADTGNTTRWAPYYNWVHNISDKDFIAGNIEYDYNNPLPNKQDYLPTREALIREIRQFIDETKDVELPIEEIKKTSYTEAEARRWQNDLMHWTLEKWLHQNRGLLDERNKYKNKAAVLEKRLKKADGGLLPEEALKIQKLEKKLDNVTFKDWITAYKKRHFQK